MALTENLDVYLEDFGVAVVWEAVSGLGILDQPDVLVADGLAVSDSYTLLVKASVFDGIQYQDSITVGGIAYKALEFKRFDDGSFARITLEKV